MSEVYLQLTVSSIEASFERGMIESNMYKFHFVSIRVLAMCNKFICTGRTKMSH